MIKLVEFHIEIHHYLTRLQIYLCLMVIRVLMQYIVNVEYENTCSTHVKCSVQRKDQKFVIKNQNLTKTIGYFTKQFPSAFELFLFLFYHFPLFSKLDHFKFQMNFLINILLRRCQVQRCTRISVVLAAKRFLSLNPVTRCWLGFFGLLQLKLINEIVGIERGQNRSHFGLCCELNRGHQSIHKEWETV